MAFSTHNKSVYEKSKETGYIRAGVGSRHRFATPDKKSAKEKSPKGQSSPAADGSLKEKFNGAPGGDTDDYATGTVVSGLDAGSGGSGFGSAGTESMDGGKNVHQMGDPDPGDKGSSMGGLDTPEMGGGSVFHMSQAEHAGMKRMNARKRR